MNGETAGQEADVPLPVEVAARLEEIYTIFEGTSEIQRLVIARAISGMRIR
ncbi:acyl-CoA dehydrogenase family protein [Kribbella pratensis]|uniref:acyl-CoA dehydrogenase family protein n=1 Tax=Kribbella pratensis TaxID=2512112 RepID=UPI00192D46DF|nr:acyl-CoA dehydrogenase family protein [Kribbella pratensis]